MDLVFNGCVELLLWLADLVGMSYKEINVWIFVIIWPLFTLTLMVRLLFCERKLRRITAEVYCK